MFALSRPATFLPMARRFIDGDAGKFGVKRMAERDGWYVVGVKEVINQLQVKW